MFKTSICKTQLRGLLANCKVLQDKSGQVKVHLMKPYGLPRNRVASSSASTEAITGNKHGSSIKWSGFTIFQRTYRLWGVNTPLPSSHFATLITPNRRIHSLNWNYSQSQDGKTTFLLHLYQPLTSSLSLQTSILKVWLGMYLACFTWSTHARNAAHVVPNSSQSRPTIME